MVLAKTGSITPHTKFTAEVYVLTKEEGGRHTPFFKGYRPQFYFRTTDVTGSVELPEGMEMVMPGDNVQMTIELITPIAMDEGLRFAIRVGSEQWHAKKSSWPAKSARIAITSPTRTSACTRSASSGRSTARAATRTSCIRKRNKWPLK
jgi:hypothetical protein